MGVLRDTRVEKEDDWLSAEAQFTDDLVLLEAEDL